MSDPTITFYPNAPGSATDYANFGVDVWENDVIPQLELDGDYTLTVYVGPRSPDDVTTFEEFKQWVNDQGYVDDNGQLHVHVVDLPFGGNSFQTGGNISSTNDAYAYYNAGKANALGAGYNANIAIMEPAHGMMYTSQCPGDNEPNHDDHTCGSIYRGDFRDEVTPMITGYEGEVGDSCNGVTNGSPEYVTDLSFCTEESIEDWLNDNFP